MRLRKRILLFGLAGMLIVIAVYIFIIYPKKSVTGTARQSTATVAAKSKTIVIVPLGDLAAGKLATVVYRQFNTILPAVRLAPLRALPSAAYYPPNHRYRADSLIAIMSRMAGENETWLGITTSDISTSIHDRTDWGVMGLGYRPGNACIASSYRLKDKTHFWKVAIHELGHTTGLDHCPVKTCFMRDAEKKNPTAEEVEFCESCRGK